VEFCENGRRRSVVLKFVTHSAARKTFEGYSGWEEFPAVWLNVAGEEMGDVTRPIPKTKAILTAEPSAQQSVDCEDSTSPPD
jgi:hypothetical protein